MQRAVGGLTDDAVDEQAAALLEGAHRVVEFVVEHVDRDVPAGGQVVVGVVQQPQRGQCGPDLDDGAAAVTAAQHVTRADARGIVPGAVARLDIRGPSVTVVSGNRR